MTNSNDKYDTVERWENIKQSYLDRADVINEMDEDELTAAQNLHSASSSLDECSEDYNFFKYDDLADFVKSYKTLKFEYNWHKSECEAKLDVMKLAREAALVLQDRNLRLNTRDVESFSSVMWRMHHFFDTRPNQHQMGKFEEHGITWDGEVDEH